MPLRFCIIVAVFSCSFNLVLAGSDWPMLRGDAQHAGFVAGEVPRAVRDAWTVDFEGERIGTAVEPVLSDGTLFAATQAGSIYALDAASGKAHWRFQASAPFLQSPAIYRSRVLAGCSDGGLYALDAKSGDVLWSTFEPGGFSAAPTVGDSSIYIGTRLGDFIASDLSSGRILWRQSIGIPIRQTASLSDGKVFVTPEDLRVRAFSSTTGKLLWTSDALSGQTARDYYPVIVKKNGRTYVLVRTNPLLSMSQRIGRDRTMLCRQAGVDDSSWKTLDAWIKSGQRGTPDLWSREQQAIVRYIETNRDAQTLVVLDAETGKQLAIPPVLWAAGCQGVGAPPAVTADGRVLIYYRSAYGNWSHGVAPLVALGLFDLAENKITPLFHQQGAKPSWNCFWGTADETQNFLVAGHTVLITHQGTLSGFDLQKNELFPLWGERDTYGGLRNPAWARNEWHGPGRAGAVMGGESIYWQTGSRIHCLVSSHAPAQLREPVAVQRIKAADVRMIKAPGLNPRNRGLLESELANAVREVLSRNWAPLFIEPGLSGRDFSFDSSADLFIALAEAFPHVPADIQQLIRERLSQEWVAHPPFNTNGFYSLQSGQPREWFAVPSNYRARVGQDKQPRPFSGVHAAWLFGEKCGEQKKVDEGWPAIRASYQDFSKSRWRLDATKGDLFANRYLASMLACARLAERAGDIETAAQARAQARETLDALIAWWQRVATLATLKSFKGAGELDPFIGKGDGLSFAVAPHRHKIALFRDLTPEIAAILRTNASPAIEAVYQGFDRLYQTWFVVGDERQVHTGENFIDPPDLAFGGFACMAWLRGASSDALARRIDVPFCRADLFHIRKVALAIGARKSPAAEM